MLPGCAYVRTHPSANTNVTGSSVATDGSAPGCSFRRIMDLRDIDGSAPDVIIIYMGVNDFARDIPLAPSSPLPFRQKAYLPPSAAPMS